MISAMDENAEAGGGVGRREHRRLRTPVTKARVPRAKGTTPPPDAATAVEAPQGTSTGDGTEANKGEDHTSSRGRACRHSEGPRTHRTAAAGTTTSTTGPRTQPRNIV